MVIPNPQLQTRSLSSLTKVFADQPLLDTPFSSASALNNESFSYQVAYHSNLLMKDLKVTVHTDLLASISLYSVALVPSELPVQFEYDDNYLRTTPGLYPDPLYPLGQDGSTATVTGLPGQWRSVWVNVQLNPKIKPGNYTIRLQFDDAEDVTLGNESFTLEVIPVSLPKQKLIRTEWLHTDCIATHYEVEVFSEKYWELVSAYVKTAASNGVNMVLTPLFTPPLDTSIGGERPTVQLVDVVKNGEGESCTYTFGFKKLERWIELCQKQGIGYFEMSHLFTQWGAKHAPKIMAEVQGKLTKLFGWETDAAGEAYRSFLNQFLPALKNFIESHELKEQVYFHVSDEPAIEHLEQYHIVSEMLNQHLNDYPIIDALSNYSFYETGAVKTPIPASNHIEPFIENNVKPLWTYYCNSQRMNVSNRLFSMPSARTRIIATQLYKFDVEGFLHWGYNFWYTWHSVKPLDPFLSTDTELAYPSGDAFLVYPGKEGPIESLRLKVFHEALQDLRALQLLESYIGKNEVMQLLEEDLADPITFSVYPKDQAWLLDMRERVNQRIKELQN